MTVTKSIARSDAQTALAAVQSYQFFQGGTTVLGMTRKALDLRRARLAQGAPSTTVTVTAGAPACNPGGLTGGSYSFTSTTDNAGNTIDTYSAFYDANCAHPEAVEVITYPPGSNPHSVSASAIVTTYDQAGNVTGYSTVKIATNLGVDVFTVTIQAAASTTIGGAPFGQLALTCTQFASGGTANCSIAAISSVGSPAGIALTTTDTFAAGPPATLTEQFTATTYTGSNLAIAAGTQPAWTITGGTATNSLVGTVAITFNGSIPVAGSIAETDATTGVSASGTIAGTGVHLTLTQSGVTVATIVLDANGTGTITYADGTTEKITAYTIVG